MGGSSADESNRPTHQQNHHYHSDGASDAKYSDVPALISPYPTGGSSTGGSAGGGSAGGGTITGIGGEERIGTVIGICAWNDDQNGSTRVDNDRHYRRGGVGSGTRANASGPGLATPPENPTIVYSPGSARVIRWDDDGTIETVRWDVDAGIYDVTHVKIKNHRIATRFTHPPTRAQRVAARYFGQDVQYGVLLRLRQQPLLPEDQALPIVKRFIGLMEWPDFSGVVVVDGTGMSLYTCYKSSP